MLLRIHEVESSGKLSERLTSAFEKREESGLTMLSDPILSVFGLNFPATLPEYFRPQAALELGDLLQVTF